MTCCDLFAPPSEPDPHEPFPMGERPANLSIPYTRGVPKQNRFGYVIGADRDGMIWAVF
jgi:hypothetical protein